MHHYLAPRDTCACWHPSAIVPGGADLVEVVLVLAGAGGVGVVVVFLVGVDGVGVVVGIVCYSYHGVALAALAALAAPHSAVIFNVLFVVVSKVVLFIILKSIPSKLVPAFFI